MLVSAIIQIAIVFAIRSGGGAHKSKGSPLQPLLRGSTKLTARYLAAFEPPSSLASRAAEVFGVYRYNTSRAENHKWPSVCLTAPGSIGQNQTGDAARRYFALSG